MLRLFKVSTIVYSICRVTGPICDVTSLFQLTYNWCLSCVLKVKLLYFLLILSWNRSTFRLLFVAFFLHFFHLVLLAIDFYLVCNKTIYDFQSMLCCHLKIRCCRCAFISPPILKDFLISFISPHLASRDIYIGSYDHELWVRRGRWASKSGSRDRCPAIL